MPFINKITNELSKRKLKSDVVANAILDIAVGNDRLDNLIANGVTHSDLESLTIGGLTTDQTAAIEKISGLSKVIGNTCSGSTSWGITVEGNNNIVSLNTTTKATRDQGIGNVVVNNIQLP